MAAGPNPFETLIAGLAGDRAASGLLKPGGAILVFDGRAERIVWASPAAASLRDALTGDDGRLEPHLSARPRLQALAAGLAPSEGMRLERLRLDPTGLTAPITCACRMAALPSGEAVLVTVIVGDLPRAAARPRPAPSTQAPPVQDLPPERLVPRAAARASGPSGSVRFVWEADAQTRFTRVSPALAAVVGPMAADIVGQTWDDLVGSVIEDGGDVASLFARRETFSGRPIRWRADNGARTVSVDFAGTPVFAPDRTLAGFRGFGLLRAEAGHGPAAAPSADAADDQARPAVAEPAAREDGEQASPAAPGAIAPAEGAGEAPRTAATADDGRPGPTALEPPRGDAPDRDREQSWFSGLRERVAATLTGTGSAPSRPAKSADHQHGLSEAERSAFREIARALGARLDDGPGAQPSAPSDPEPPEPAGADPLLERLPVGVVVHRDGVILFANRRLLEMVAYDDLGQLRAERDFAALFGGSPTLAPAADGASHGVLATRRGEFVPVEVQPSTADWDGAPATLMLVRRVPEPDPRERLDAEARIRELESILDTATDGVILLDETGRILALNRSAEALFGYDQREVVGDAVTVLLAPESHIIALEYLEGLRSPGVASLLNDGREVMGRVRQGGAIPLFMTMGCVNEGPERKFCAVLRDITAFKKAEGELIAAKRAAEEASAQKSDLLAKISHEIRTPLNAIIGFAEVMLEERFGPIGNERYKDYLKDVHASGAHVISLVNDLLDLAKIEAGRMELSFATVSLNELVGATVALLQPQAARDRIVMRTSFTPKLPPVVADERSVRQIVLNLVSNAIKFTDAGGQVIVSTAVTDRGEVAFRVRDTGIGMTEEEIEAALEPFRQLATARKRGGTGLGLPLTKALVEANRGALRLSSSPNEGTLVEVLFPPTRVLAE